MTRPLITGGADFIGSHLAETLVSQGDEVLALDSLATGRLANLGTLVANPRFRFVQGSVLDEPAADRAVRSCEVVVHLAAAVGVKLIVEEPFYSLTTKIKGAITVLEAAHRYRRKVMVASSSKIYGKNSVVPLDEQSDRVLGSPAVARWTYLTSKAVNEILAYAYHPQRDLPTIVVRLFSTVGPRQSPAYGMVIPRLLRQAIAGEPLTVYGDGTQTRFFCHVAAVVRALLGFLDEPRAEGNVFNIGSSEETSIADLARLLIERTGSTSGIMYTPYDFAYETGVEDITRSVPDTARINSLTGWHARHRLSQVLDNLAGEAGGDLVRRLDAVPRAEELPDKQ